MMNSVAENLALYIHFFLLYRLTTLVFVQAIPCLRVLELEWIGTVFDLRLVSRICHYAVRLGPACSGVLVGSTN